MRAIKNNITNEIIINKSRFICCLIKVYNEEEALMELENVKKKYKDASHYCYAYIIDNIRRFNDDGEPSGTAGIPIMEVLLKNNVNYIVGIVARYFGGTKLGAGGLVRAYSKSAREALNKVFIVDLVKAKQIKIIFDYDLTKDIEHILKDQIITDKQYKDRVEYTANIKLNEIINQLQVLKNIEIIELNDVYIELGE